MPNAVDQVEPQISAPAPPPKEKPTGLTRAQSAMEALDERYEPAWWRLQLRRHGALVASVALAAVAIAGTALALRARRTPRWRKWIAAVPKMFS
jgi:hypothetical protein